MTVKPDSPRRFDYKDRTYLFCSDGCLAKFRANPEHYLSNPPQTRSHGHGMPMQIVRSASGAAGSAPPQRGGPSGAGVTAFTGSGGAPVRQSPGDGGSAAPTTDLPGRA